MRQGLAAQIAVLAALYALGWSAAAMAAETPSQSVDRLLQAKAFQFCDKEYHLGYGDRRWCPIAEKMHSCGAFAQACSRHAAAIAAGNETEQEAAKRRNAEQARKLGKGNSQSAADREKMRREQDSARVPGFLRDIMVGVVVALLLWMLLQWWRNRQPSADETIGQPIAATAELVDLEMPDAGSLPTVAKALAKAQALAATQPGPALAWLYAAALRSLQDAGQLQWQPTLTNRTVLRQMAKNAPLHAPLRQLVLSLELWRFGAQAPTAEDVHAWAEHFGMDRAKNRIVLAGTADLLGTASYNLIPGFQLIDKDFIVRSDSTGENPSRNLYQELLPMIPKLLE